LAITCNGCVNEEGELTFGDIEGLDHRIAAILYSGKYVELDCVVITILEELEDITTVHTAHCEATLRRTHFVDF
jgi:hypothetical protein